MLKPLDMLVRHATIDGANTVDCRVVITADGRAAMIGRPTGEIALLCQMTNVLEWGVTAAGRLHVTDGIIRWEGDRESRCGSCAGRYELRSVDAALFLPRADPEPEAPDDNGTVTVPDVDHAHVAEDAE